MFNSMVYVMCRSGLICVELLLQCQELWAIYLPR